jgi:hypothetical protein
MRVCCAPNWSRGASVLQIRSPQRALNLRRLAVAEMLVIAILNLWLFIFAVPAYYSPSGPSGSEKPTL